MVLGTSSGAGKSWLTSALCRHYARQGLKVAPFKAQNMSNNARVVRDAAGRWGEIGSAQFFQALAARAEPAVAMNPVLLKPEADTRSQVICMGQVDRALGAMPWRERSAHLWPVVREALDGLMASHDVVVIEGAGSPAEINLQSSDIVNLAVARHVQARCLLVCDIDRGGAFAHLYGTWALLPPDVRSLLRGFVLNKFRGDESLLAPAPRQLEDLTGVPTLAVVPMLREHGLPEEDGWLGAFVPAQAAGPVASGLRVVVIAYPHISNLDEFQPLSGLPGVQLRWTREPDGLADLKPGDIVVLPGSKQTAQDLSWLRARGLDAAVAAHAGRGGRVLGICGGLQMLGEALIDTHGVDGNGPGLGLLPLVTAFEPDKTLARRRLVFDRLDGPWAMWSGLAVEGYEIHHGRTERHPAMARAGDVARAVLPDDLGWQSFGGQVLGVYVHGLFEQPEVLQALAAQASPAATDELTPTAVPPPLDAVFDGLADHVAPRFGPGVLAALATPD
ncbi:cobyric acid synthase [Comamonadaceae bacterium PP-2]